MAFPGHQIEVSVEESSNWSFLGLEKLIISELHFYAFVDKRILIWVQPQCGKLETDLTFLDRAA